MTLQQDISSRKAWWKEAAVYQIYPSSFKDSNGDGYGDVQGVIQKLDYIKRLGVDIVWLSPIYQSPQVDNGYDISHYREIDPRYGSMQDVDRLIEGLHSRGLKLMMDLVINHTSDQHEWFKQARSSKSNQYRDWYIWRKPRFVDGKRMPPNNWSAYFGGSAWTYDEASGEYYLHLFAPEQPDLNWECDAMRAEIYDTIRFWLDKGVDGFRMDVINLISKDPELPDARVVRPGEYQHGCEHYANGPRLHEYLNVMGSILAEYNAVSVGEMPWISDEAEILRCVGQDRNELNMIFNFDIVEGIDHGEGGKFSPKEWQMSELKAIVDKWQQVMHRNGGWNALFLENHDQARTVSRWGSDSAEQREQCAKMFATFLGLQSGTVFLYQGQELGMTSIPQDWEMQEFRDLETLNHWQDLLDQHTGQAALQETKKQYHLKSRDNARTPMQWDAGTHAGFSDSQPWFRVNDTFQDCNAANQLGRADSPFEYWRSILMLRKAMPEIFVYGDFEMVDKENEDVFAFTRDRGRALVVCNFRSRRVQWSIPKGLDLSRSSVLIGGCGSVEARTGMLSLEPFEAFACLLKRGSARLVSSL